MGKKSVNRREGGLFLGDAIRLTNEKERRYPVAVAEGVILLFLLCGVLLTLEGAIGLPVGRPLLCSALAFSALIPLLYHLPRFRWLGLAGTGTGYLLLIYLNWDAVREGSLLIWNQLALKLNSYFAACFLAEELDLAADVLAQKLLPAELVLLFFLAFTGGAAIVCTRSMMELALVECVFFWMAINLADSTLLPPILLFTLSLLMVYAMKCASPAGSPKQLTGDFAPGKGRKAQIHRMANASKSSNIIVSGALSVLSVSLAVMLATGLVFPREQYQWNETLAEFNQDPLEFFQNLPNPFAHKGHQGIGYGSLGTVDRVELQGTLHLRVQVENPQAPLYLRGFVGSVYDGHSWKALPNSAYRENRELFDRIAENQLTPLTLSYPFYNDFDADVVGKPQWDEAGQQWGTDGSSSADFARLNHIQFQKTSLTVENVNANRAYAYNPYCLFTTPFNSEWKASSFIRDTMLKSPPTVHEKYTMEYYRKAASLYWLSDLDSAGTLMDYYDASNSAGIRLMQEYGDFVREEYLQLPSRGVERIKSEYSPGQIQAAGGTEHSPVYQAAKKICEDLARMASYDLAPGRTPSDQDFAEYFLYRNKKGYCMHFATAATLMFRAAGIPARYVEGYIVTDKDYVSSDMAEIYDRNAHAWTEIYVAPYGWVPIETTPGFSGDSIAPPEYNTSRPEESAESSEASEAASEVSEGEASSEPLSSAEASAAQPLPSSQTDSGGTGESSDVIPPEEKLSPAAVKGLAASGTIVGVLLLLAGILWLRRRLALNRRKREYAGPDSRQAALAVYRHVERLLAFAGQEPGNETPREFAARLEKEWNGLPQGKSLLRVTVAAEEARFGGGRPYSQENLTLLLEYDRALEKRVADGLSLWGRFRYFLLWNLE